jgi:hypothetical protein
LKKRGLSRNYEDNSRSRNKRLLKRLRRSNGVLSVLEKLYFIAAGTPRIVAIHARRIIGLPIWLRARRMQVEIAA